MKIFGAMMVALKIKMHVIKMNTQKKLNTYYGWVIELMVSDRINGESSYK